MYINYDDLDNFDEMNFTDPYSYRQPPPPKPPKPPRPPRPPQPQGPGSGFFPPLFPPGFNPGQGQHDHYPGEQYGPEGHIQGYPPGPPPSKQPQKQYGTMLKAVEPGTIRLCTYRYVYLWLDNGRSFWAWLLYVGRTSVYGWRWNGFRWINFGLDTRRIDAFDCY